MRWERRQLVTMVVSGLACLCLVAAPARAVDDDEVPLDKVPAWVRKAAETAVPGFKLVKAYKVEEKGTPEKTPTADSKVTPEAKVKATRMYELEGQDAKKQDYTIVVNARGQVLEIDIAVALSAVPKPVLAALQGHPKAKDVKFTEAAKVTRGGKLIAYQFEGQDAKKKDVIASVSPDGKTVEIDADTD